MDGILYSEISFELASSKLLLQAQCDTSQLFAPALFRSLSAIEQDMRRERNRDSGYDVPLTDI